MKRKIPVILTAVLLVAVVVVCAFVLRAANQMPCPDCADGAATACATCNGAGEVLADSPYYATFMSLMPALIAIVLALITKEVYSSLFIGIVCGALFTTDFNVVGSLDTILEDALIAAVSGTAGIFVFLVVLGILVALINKAGGSAAFGRWAATHIKSRVGASLCTFVLGVLIFIDDYFNCLTVGSVMRPVTDNHKISRAKLAYLIDATAAPVCMIAPISSWAAAVSEYTTGVVDAAGNEISGLALFCRAIPYNLYSLLTFVFIITIVLMKLDYGPMRRHERNALGGDLFTNGGEVVSGEDMEQGNSRGRVVDLLLPIIALIAVSVVALVYVGGFFGGDTNGDFIGAFGNTDATVGLPLGGILVLVLTVLYLICRRLVSFKEAMACIPKGFIAMVPAILILTMATGLKNITGLLGSDVFVETALANAGALRNFLPAIIFLVACGISFATGTSWGTFGILIPIVLSVFPAGSELMIIGMSACLAGAVCGDHCSPISDTTIMSSAGAQCEHVNHVSTQLPYAITVAAVSFVGYILAGIIQNAWVVLTASAVLLLVVLFAIRGVTNKKAL